MSESYFADTNDIEWHTHDIYDGAGGNVRHGHHGGKSPHPHDWDTAVPVTQDRDGFFIEAIRLREEQSTTESSASQP